MHRKKEHVDQKSAIAEIFPNNIFRHDKEKIHRTRSIPEVLFYSKLLILLLFTACSDEGPDTGEIQEVSYVPAEIRLNVSYGTDEAQVYDLYLPAGRSPSSTGVLVFIHGGGWIQGDKADMQEYIPLLQEMHPEHAIVNLNYRLAKPPEEAAFPNQFLDLRQALEQLIAQAEDLGIKAEFGLIGASAGGHIALQYDSVYDTDDHVKLVCSIVGPTNLTDPFYTQNSEFAMALDLLVDESAYPNVDNYAHAVSPAYHVNPENSPTILFYGEDDPLVPVSNGHFLKEQLDASGIDNALTLYSGGHGDWGNQDNSDMQLELSRFIDLHLPIGE